MQYCLLVLTLALIADPSFCASESADVCSECKVLSGRGPCVGLITRPEESYEFNGSECDR